MIPGHLVHMLIIAILGAVVSIGAYMVAWAFNDSAWKAQINTRMTQIELMIAEVRTQVNTGILPKAEEKIEQLNYRDDQIEKHHDDLSRRLERLEQQGRKQ